MANAKRDGNHIPTLIAPSSDDGVTVVNIVADPTTHELSVEDGTTGIDHGRTIAVRDDNHVAVLMATSSADGLTSIEVYTTSDGKLLIDSL